MIPSSPRKPLRWLGLKTPDRILSVLRSLAGHPNTQRLTPAGRKKLARLVPVLLRKAGRVKDSDALLVRLVDLIITIERRTNLSVSAHREYPGPGHPDHPGGKKSLDHLFSGQPPGAAG